MCEHTLSENAAVQALMQQFKDSVLDDDGLSVRAMSDESAKELAGQTTDGILDLVGDRKTPRYVENITVPATTTTTTTKAAAATR